MVAKIKNLTKPKRLHHMHLNVDSSAKLLI